MWCIQIYSTRVSAVAAAAETAAAPSPGHAAVIGEPLHLRGNRSQRRPERCAR